MRRKKKNEKKENCVGKNKHSKEKRGIHCARQLQLVACALLTFDAEQ